MKSGFMKDTQFESKCKFNTPIFFLNFNRSNKTRSVFEAIRQVKPNKLYIAADGPRKNKNDCLYWTEVFNSVYEGKIETWDYQFVFACWIQNSLAILPNANLVSNIGFGEEATHMKNQNDLAANVDSLDLEYSLSHPPFKLRDSIADNLTKIRLFFKKLFDKTNNNKIENISEYTYLTGQNCLFNFHLFRIMACKVRA